MEKWRKVSMTNRQKKRVIKVHKGSLDKLKKVDGSFWMFK